MEKKILCLMLAAVLLLTGCGAQPSLAHTSETAAQTTAPAATEPGATVPADGEAGTVTQKGSYTAENPDPDAVVATVEAEVLTNGQLQALYWLVVAQYQAAGTSPAPDFDAPLDTQACSADDSVGSWQQFFLCRALNVWHSAQALVLQSTQVGLPTEEAYQPNMTNHAKYMVDIPATAYLYGYNNNYRINTLHQEYLDSLPDTLAALAQKKGMADGEDLAQAAAGVTQEALLACARILNEGYAYYTSLSYSAEPSQEALDSWMAEHAGEGTDERYVSIRQILVIPEDGEVSDSGIVTASEESWSQAQQQAEKMLAEYQRNLAKSKQGISKSTPDAVFADYAHSHSQDTDNAPNGGLYYHVAQGQLLEALDSWCFDESRQEGDTAVLRTECGWHVLFFQGAVDGDQWQAQTELTAQAQEEALWQIRQSYPMTVDYGAIALGRGKDPGCLTLSEVLYADVGHERYPEIPLYLQQDYPSTMYGSFQIRTNGCGITTMAMVASYLGDEEYTPPELCARYGRYSFSNGTDGSLFNYTPSEMGFYLKKKTYEFREALEALKEGHVVVCLQTKGYWTRGGHYLALYHAWEDPEDPDNPLIQVRDSNIFNYGKLQGHYVDAFSWKKIPPNATAFWIFEYKNVTLDICHRCGDPNGTTQTILSGDYICEKCQAALLRRSSFLSACTE